MKNTPKLKIKIRQRRVRAKISGTATRPRLAVFRSNRFTYAQLIDDNSGKTLVSVSSRGLAAKNKTEQAKAIGEKMAEAAKKTGLTAAVFDRRHYQYHGRVKAVAEGARMGGLKL